MRRDGEGRLQHFKHPASETNLKCQVFRPLSVRKKKKDKRQSFLRASPKNIGYQVSLAQGRNGWHLVLLGS